MNDSREERAANLSLQQADPELAAELGVGARSWRNPVMAEGGPVALEEHRPLHVEYVLYGPLPEITVDEIRQAEPVDVIDGWEARHPRSWPAWLYALCREEDGRILLRGIVETTRSGPEDASTR